MRDIVACAGSKCVSKMNPEGVYDLKDGMKKPMIGKVKVIEGIRPGVVL